jgi:hypothetical protein
LFGSFLPSLFGWFGTTKVYSGLGADILMESITAFSVDALFRENWQGQDAVNSYSTALVRLEDGQRNCG